MLEKIKLIPVKMKIIFTAVIGVLIAAVIIFINGMVSEPEVITVMAAQWPDCFASEEYEEPVFKEDKNRDNNAFNVADFGEQGSNGWFYRYGNSTKPSKSKYIEKYNGESYRQTQVDGLEIKKDFVHTGNGVAAILEWRAAKKGSVNLKLAYVKNVNGDKNPGFPDGVTIYLYKGDELLETHQVEIKVDEETLLETNIDGLAMEEKESIYIIIDPKDNNAFDGGLLYAAIVDVNKAPPSITVDESRKDNNANNVKDYGSQGANGWRYMYGKDIEHSELVSSETEDGYINYTSPALVIKKDFIHPAINDNAILSWTPAVSGTIEVRGKYTKFEQNDGNPAWPDGVIVQVYLNQQKLFEQEVKAPDKGTESINIREVQLNVTPEDRLYFVVNANGNSSYDGGSFDISILDRNGRVNEDAVTVKESEIRQNIANVKDDFGEQGANGWFYQEGYQDEPFGAYNMEQYIEGDKYADDSYLEIKRDYVNTGENGKSAVIKWKVAQNGTIKIDASYTKTKNEDSNPEWPDGTRVTLWHNNTELISEEFAPEVSQEITKSLNVERVSVKKGDYITMVVNGKDNNAYDGGKYTFSISSLSGLAGTSEDDIIIENDEIRTNNANVLTDFGKQGSNGWFYLEGGSIEGASMLTKKTDDSAGYQSTTESDLQMKKDYVQPGALKDAMYQWVVAQNGQIDIIGSYVKFGHNDGNPAWPDGTIVRVYLNNTLLFEQKAVVLQGDGNDTVVRLNLEKRQVRKDDVLTFSISAGSNNAWDGGRLSIQIKPHAAEAEYKPADSNSANLFKDFGEQGSNGWYYGYGNNSAGFKMADKTGDEYVSALYDGLLLKKDGVHPNSDTGAVYRWIAGENGQINVKGTYYKSRNENPDDKAPDGIKVSVYKNGTLIEGMSYDIAVLTDRENVQQIEKEKLDVTRGDKIDFIITAKGNASWDFGKLEMNISDANEVEKPIEYQPASSNTADLFKDFGGQGSNGWYYGYGNTSEEFKTADKAGEEYTSALYSGLLLKKDGVHPSGTAGAIYRWIVGADGKLNLNGTYYKSRNENAEDKEPDGVKVEVYKNGKLIEGMSYDIAVFTDKENVQQVEKFGLEVSRGDKIDFIISAKENKAWDFGKLEMKISDASESEEPTKPEEPEKPEERTNNTNLFNSFGEQGNDGWYYGTCEWNGLNFQQLIYDAVEDRYYNNGKPELKKDFVEPGNNLNAAYKWIAAQDGTIKINGEYEKFANAADANANGVCLRIFQNAEEKKWIGGPIMGGNIAESVKVIIEETLTVKKGDEIIFAVNPEGNDSYDGGRLSIDITSAD